MDFKYFSYTKSIVAQKDISEGDKTAYITQLSKPIFIKGVSTKKCQNVLYSIDGMNFTEETNIGDNKVLSIAVVPFQIGGAEINSKASVITNSMIINAFSYILGGRDINEDLSIKDNIGRLIGNDGIGNANGAYRYLLQYLAKHRSRIAWNTGSLFSMLDADRQDLFGGSDFITDTIYVGNTGGYSYELWIDKQTDANGSILKPKFIVPLPDHVSNSNVQIYQSPYFFLYPEACPASDGDPDKLIIDNFWRGGGALISQQPHEGNFQMFMLYIFAVT